MLVVVIVVVVVVSGHVTVNGTIPEHRNVVTLVPVSILFLQRVVGTLSVQVGCLVTVPMPVRSLGTIRVPVLSLGTVTFLLRSLRTVPLRG